MNTLLEKFIEFRLLGKFERVMTFPTNTEDSQFINDYVFNRIYWRSRGVARAEQGDKTSSLVIEDFHVRRAIKLEKEHYYFNWHSNNDYEIIYRLLHQALHDICIQHGIEE
jgi:hypothetical protein